MAAIPKMAALPKPAAITRYDELRLKTDRQLIRLANTELDLGIRDAREALESAENWASARGHYLLAKRAYAQAARLIRLTGDIGGGDLISGELINVDARLAQLGEVLEGLSVLSAAAVPARDKTPALARALWKAKGCPEGSAEEDWFQAERVLQSHAACVSG
jgi:hypothetical protein